MLSLLIVGVLGLLGSLLVASTKSGDNTAAVLVAQYRLDRAATAPIDQHAGAASFVVEGKESRFSHEENHPVDFNFRETWTLIGQAATSPGHGSGSQRNLFSPELYHVEIVVWWMVDNPDDGRAEGGGKRSVTLERVISHYENDL